MIATPHILYIVFLWLVVLYADFIMTRHNMGSDFNGVGSIPTVLRSEAYLPMQNRVLIPWLCYLFNRQSIVEPPVRTYLYLRWVLILVSLFSCYWYFSTLHISPILPITIVSLFYVWAALYDYSDIYSEIAILALALGVINTQTNYGFLALIVLSFVGGLNKETIVIIPISLLLLGMKQEAMISGAFCFGGMALPHIIYGKKERYCSFNQVMGNLKGIKDGYTSGAPWLLNEYTIFFALAGFATIAYVTLGTISPVDYAIIITCLALIVPTKWREVRVFAPIILSLAPRIAGVL